MRIVPMAPNLVETVFALGAGDRVVGVSDFTVHPDAALDLPRLGGTFNANLELLTRLSPDLVIVQGEHPQVARLCEARGIRLLRVRMDSLATVCSGILEIGAALGKNDAALLLVQEIELGLRDLATRGGRGTQSVALVMGRADGSLRGMSTFGGDTFVAEVLHLLGGRNVVAGDARGYPAVSLEAIAAAAPHVIIELRAGETITPERAARLRADWDILGHVPAVRSGRIRFLTEPGLLIPGPRVVEMARVMAEAMDIEWEDG